MSNKASKQPDPRVTPERKTAISGQLNRSVLFFWFTPFKSIFHLTAMRNALLSETDKSVLKQKDRVDQAELDKISSIESIQKLIDINIAAILNGFLVLLFILVVIISIILLLPVNSTKVKIDVKVTSLEWDNAVYADNKLRRYNFSLLTPEVQNVFMDSAIVTSSTFGLNGHADLNLDSVRGLEILNISFPRQSRGKLQYDENRGMNLSVYSLGDTSLNSLFAFDMSFLESNLSLPNRSSPVHVGAEDVNVPPQQASISKDLRSGRVYVLNFLIPKYWKWPVGLHATNISFAEKDARDDDPVSSIIYGRINMLETSDSAITLNERDILKANFIDPVDLFLSGDSTGIFVHLEGEVDALEFGPKIMGEKNERMPTRIKKISEKAPYAWILATTIISLITLIKIRDR